MKESISEDSSENLISEHIFSMPILYDSKSKMDQFEEALAQSTYIWERIYFEKNTEGFVVKHYDIKAKEKINLDIDKQDIANYYNQKQYFYPEVMKLIHDTSDSDLVRRYEIKAKSGSYNIVVDDGEKRNYSLNIKKIELRVYSIGVAVLIFRLENYAYKKIEDILEINQRGRHVSWPFVSHLTKSDEFKIIDNIDYKISEESLVSNEIYLTLEGYDYLSSSLEHNRLKKGNPNTTEVTALPISGIVTGLLGNGFYHITNQGSNDKGLKYDLVLDDRMHTSSFLYGCNKLSMNRLYEYIFIDNYKDSELLGEDFINKSIGDSLYSRWKSTRFYTTKYSFSMIYTNDDCSFYDNFVTEHFNNLYYEMIVIFLIQKSALQRFTKDLANISLDNLKTKKDGFNQLQEEYLKFIANYCFDAVTEQDQGIEMYDLLKSQTRIDQRVEIINHKIEQVHSFYDLMSNNVLQRSILKLTIASVSVALLGLFGQMIISFFEKIISLILVSNDSMLFIFKIIFYCFTI